MTIEIHIGIDRSVSTRSGVAGLGKNKSTWTSGSILTSYPVGSSEIWFFLDEKWVDAEKLVEVGKSGDRSIVPPLNINLDKKCLFSVIHSFGRPGYFTIIVCSDGFGFLYSSDSDLGYENNSTSVFISDEDVERARREVESMFLIES